MKYNREVIIEKNMTLSFEFERYLLENPAVMEQIPNDAEVVLLPKDDPELYQINLKAAQEAQAKGEKALVVFVEIEALAPPRSRIVNPRLMAHPTIRAS